MALRAIVLLSLVCVCYSFAVMPTTKSWDSAGVEIPQPYYENRMHYPTSSGRREGGFPSSWSTRNRFKRDAEKERGSVNVHAEQRWQGHKNMGTDFGVQANRRLWESQNGRSTVDAHANYNRHFGGPSGTGRPSYGGGVTFNHRF